MKITTAYAFIWISVAIAISVGVYVSKSATPLWALLIPACISVSSGDKEE
jgi:hypothetical protein